MKKTKKTSPVSEFKKQVSKIKINTKLNSVEDTPFFKKKMAKGIKMLSVAGLPK
jgi:hypothetical protein